MDDPDPTAAFVSEQPGASQIARRAARGVATSLAGQVVRVVIQTGSVIILARLLVPADYGLLAMVLVIIGVGEILRDFGLSAAAVQSPTLTPTERNGLFWLNTAIGAVLSIALFAAAPLVSLAYGEPVLRDLTRVLALTFLMNGAATQFRAGLERDLRFGALASVDVAGQAAGAATAISCAAAGWGLWALAAQQMAASGTMLAVAVASGGWLPGRPRRLGEVRRFVRFGWYLATSQLIGYATNNVDTLVIGLFLGKAPLGLYNRAFQLLMQSYNLVRGPVAKVAVSVLARLHDDPALYRRFLLRGQLALGYTLVLPLAVVAACGDAVVSLLLGPAWAAAAPILRCLAVAAAFETLTFVGYWVYVSRALTRDLLRFSPVSAVIKIVCIVVGSQFGLLGVAVGFAASPALTWPISLWWLSRCTEVPARGLAIVAVRLIGVATIVGSAAALADRHVVGPDVLILGAGFAAGVAALACLAAAVPHVRRDLRQVHLAIAAVRT